MFGKRKYYKQYILPDNMGLFGFSKKKDVLDLTERYKKQQEKLAQVQSESQESSQSTSQNAFSFLGDLASSSNSETQSEEYVDVSGAEDKRKKLAKRLMDMTAKMEDLSNQIYHLQQRVELLEKKSSVGY